MKIIAHIPYKMLLNKLIGLILLLSIFVVSCKENDSAQPDSPKSIGRVSGSEVVDVKAGTELKMAMGQNYRDFVGRAFKTRDNFEIKSREILKVEGKFYMKTFLTLENGDKGTVFTELSVDALGDLHATSTGYSCKSDGGCNDGCVFEITSGSARCYCGRGGNGCVVVTD